MSSVEHIHHRDMAVELLGPEQWTLTHDLPLAVSRVLENEVQVVFVDEALNPDEPIPSNPAERQTWMQAATDACNEPLSIQFQTELTQAEAAELLCATELRDGPSPSPEQIGRALRAMVNGSAQFKKNALGKTEGLTRKAVYDAMVVAEVAQNQHHAKHIRELAVWLEKQPLTIELYSDIALIPLASISDEELHGIMHRYPIEVFARMYDDMRTSGRDTTEETIEDKILTFLTTGDNDKFVASNKGRRYSNPDTLMRRYAEIGDVKRAKLHSAFYETLITEDAERFLEAFEHIFEQRILVDGDKRYYVTSSRDKKLLENTLNGSGTMFRVLPDEDTDRYFVYKTTTHRLGRKKPLFERGAEADMLSAARGNAVLGELVVAYCMEHRHELGDVAAQTAPQDEAEAISALLDAFFERPKVKSRHSSPTTRSAQDIALGIAYRLYRQDKQKAFAQAAVTESVNASASMMLH